MATLTADQLTLIDNSIKKVLGKNNSNLNAVKNYIITKVTDNVIDIKDIQQRLGSVVREAISNTMPIDASNAVGVKVIDGVTYQGDGEGRYIEVNNSSGTGGTSNTTANVNDVTIGKVLKVGDLGIGKSLYSIIDVNNLKTAGSYYVNGASPNIPVSYDGWLTVTIASTDDLNLMQVFVKVTANNLTRNTVYIRNYITGTNYWSPWQEQAAVEYGTFTPVVNGTVTTGVGTYSMQTGTYTKINRRVHFQIYLGITAHTGTGNIIVGGLPYRTSEYTVVNVGHIGNLTYSGTLTGFLDTYDVGLIRLESNVPNTSLTAIPMDTSFGFMISGSYDALQ